MCRSGSTAQQQMAPQETPLWRPHGLWVQQTRSPLGSIVTQSSGEFRGLQGRIVGSSLRSGIFMVQFGLGLSGS